ncbi:MAG: hypothetical protein HYW10_03310, partial [Candidatus Omnitrophica bacterium]|nr:hypothetical protein [Candidatus Omnitrophota bacterium]
DLPLLVSSWLLTGVGIWLAWTVGVKHRRLLPVPLRPLGSRLYRLAANKYYVDELYARFLIKPFLAAANGLSRFDLRVIDGAVDRAGQLGWSIGQWKERFDQAVVDRLVNGLARMVRGLGASLRWLQTGIIQQYLLVVVVAVVVFSAIMRR